MEVISYVWFCHGGACKLTGCRDGSDYTSSTTDAEEKNVDILLLCVLNTSYPMNFSECSIVINLDKAAKSLMTSYFQFPEATKAEHNKLLLKIRRLPFQK